MISKIDANGITINYSYDNLKRLTNIDYPGTDSDVVYTYDANGNRLTMENGWTDFEWTYDVNNKILTQTNNVLNKTIEYTYDANGNRATMTDGENGITEYTYDDVNRLTRIENPDNENTDYTYGNAGEKLLQTNANGTLAEYNYDDLYRLVLLANKKSNGDTISSFVYSYDNAGNRMSKIYENGDTEIYSYDCLYQLVKVQTKDKTTEYEYDKVGNRMQMKVLTTNDTNITNYNYNNDNQLISYSINETDTVSFEYDNNGNQIAKGDNNDTHYYTYDFDNNMIGISAVNDTNVISYIYSPDGKRLKKYLNGIGTKYFYDNDDVTTEYDTNTTVQIHYTNNLGIDDIISAKRNSNVEYYHKDALGSVVNLTSNIENINVSYRYSAFGSIESQSNSHQNEYTYTGRQIDREAGLYYYRSRYYNSEIGRFIKKDDFKGNIYKNLSLNYYIYCFNTPSNLNDPYGFSPSIPRIIYRTLRREAINNAADCGFECEVFMRNKYGSKTDIIASHIIKAELRGIGNVKCTFQRKVKRNFKTEYGIKCSLSGTFQYERIERTDDHGDKEYIENTIHNTVATIGTGSASTETDRKSLCDLEYSNPSYDDNPDAGYTKDVLSYSFP